MMFRFRPLCLISVAGLLVLFACDPLAREANINQNKYIDDYLTKQYADHTVYRDGSICRVVLQEGASGAPVIERGDSASFYYAAFIFDQKGPSTQFALDSATFRIGSGDLVPGLDKGLPGTRLGEEVLIVFPAEDGYGTRQTGLVPENSALLFDIIVTAIKKNP